MDELEDKKGTEDEIEEAGDFSERVLEIVVEIESVLSRKEKAESGSDSASPNPTATSATSGNKHSTRKLPRLTLKSFLGDPGQFLTFWDSFRSSVHENPELHDIDKFNCLKSLLGGSATITGLPLTSDNCTEAIELLTKRFGNKQVIISSHWTAF